MAPDREFKVELNALVEFVEQWRKDKTIDGDAPLSHDHLVAFAADFKEKAELFSVAPERIAGGTYSPETPQKWDADAMVIPYAGSAGGVACWKHAKAMSENGDGKVCYISDTPAGQLLASTKLTDAIADALGGSNEKLGGELARTLFDGSVESGVRSTKSFGDVTAINDVVSEKLMREMAYGDVRTITHNAPDNSVFVQTELPALLDSDRVTAINGIPIEQLREVRQRTGSLLEVNALVAEASRNLMEGTRFTMTAEDGSDGRTPDRVASIDGAKLFAGSGVAGPVFEANGALEKVITAPQIAVLTIDKMDTAAFQDLGRNVELSSILTDAAHRIESGTQSWFPLHDTNGNDVGSFDIVVVAPQSPPEPGTARLQFDLSAPEFQQNRAAQLSQAIHAAADQVGAPDATSHIIVASPEGKAIGMMDVHAKAPSVDPDPTMTRECETFAP